MEGRERGRRERKGRVKGGKREGEEEREKMREGEGEEDILMYLKVTIFNEGIKFLLFGSNMQKFVPSNINHKIHTCS